MRRIPVPALLSLATRYGLDPETIRPPEQARDGSDGVLLPFMRNGTRALLKLLPVSGLDLDLVRIQADQRLRYLEYLRRHEVGVVTVLHSLNGNRVEFWSDGEFACAAYAMEHIPGHHPTETEQTDVFFRTFGQMLGQLHRVSRRFSLREQLPPDADAPDGLDWMSEWTYFYELLSEPRIRSCWEDLRVELDRLPRTAASYGFTHNDPHLFNILIRDSDGALILLDPDVARRNWYAADIPTALQTSLFRHGGLTGPVRNAEQLRREAASFMDGYSAESPVDTAFRSTLDLFLQYRRILLYAVFARTPDRTRAEREQWRHCILEPPTVLRGRV